MAKKKIRYATTPPNCDALKKADQLVLNEYSKAEHQPNDLVNPGPPATFKRKIDFDAKKDGKYRATWMQAYVDHGGPVATVNPHLTPGTLTAYCEKPKPSITKLIVYVRNLCDKSLVPKARVNIAIQKNGSHFASSGQDAPTGKATFSGLSPGDYIAYISRPWRRPFLQHLDPKLAEEGIKARVIKDSTTTATINLQPASFLLKVISRTTMLANANVKVTGGLGGRHEQQKKTGSDGRTKFEFLKPHEKYKIQVWKDGHTPWEKEHFLERCENKEFDISCDPQLNSSLHITLLDWNKSRVPHTRVTATPLWKTLPRKRRSREQEPWVKTRFNLTDQQGVCIFAKKKDNVDSSLRSGAKYVISASAYISMPVFNNAGRKSKIHIPSKNQTVYLTNLSPTFTNQTLKKTLHLVREKSRRMSIRIDSASWLIGSLPKPLPPIFGMSIALTIAITDLITRQQARYIATFFVGGITASADLIKLPANGVTTTGPGIDIPFTIKRFDGNEVVTEESFASPAELGFTKIDLGVANIKVFNLLFLTPTLRIEGLTPGPTTFTLPSLEGKKGFSINIATFERLKK